MRTNPPVEVYNDALWSGNHRRLCSPIRSRRFKYDCYTGVARAFNGAFHVLHLDMQNNPCRLLYGNERTRTEHNRYRPSVKFSKSSIFNADSQPNDVAEKRSSGRNVAHK